MARYWVVKVARFAIFATLAVGVFGFVVMSLWNWLMPALVGAQPIGFWQALGLLILSKILFGGFRGGSGRHMRWRHWKAERWGQMTPEERERFRGGLRGCCGPLGASGSETPA